MRSFVYFCSAIALSLILERTKASSTACNINGKFFGLLTNTTFVWDDDSNEWIPDVHKYAETTSVEVTWDFSGSTMLQTLRVWGYPLQGPDVTDDAAVEETIRTQLTQQFDSCEVGNLVEEMGDISFSPDPEGTILQFTQRQLLTTSFDYCSFLVGSSVMRIDKSAFIGATWNGPQMIIVPGDNITFAAIPDDPVSRAPGAPNKLWPHPRAPTINFTGSFPQDTKCDSINYNAWIPPFTEEFCVKYDSSLMNCVSALLTYKDDSEEPSFSFIIIISAGTILFASGWIYLFWSVQDPKATENEAVPSSGYNLTANYSPVSSRLQRQLRCLACGAAVEDEFADRCRLCGSDQIHMLVGQTWEPMAFNNQTQRWEKVKQKNSQQSLNYGSFHRKSMSAREPNRKNRTWSS